MPGPGGYWFAPLRIACTAASATSGGPSVSGKPCPRLTDPVASASADISAKIVVPSPSSRRAMSCRVTRATLGAAGHRRCAVMVTRTVSLDVAPSSSVAENT